MFHSWRWGALTLVELSVGFHKLYSSIEEICRPTGGIACYKLPLLPWWANILWEEGQNDETRTDTGCWLCGPVSTAKAMASSTMSIRLQCLQVCITITSSMEMLNTGYPWIIDFFKCCTCLTACRTTLHWKLSFANSELWRLDHRGNLSCVVSD